MKVSLQDIHIGDRKRQEMGDVKGLAENMKENGQITAVTLRPPNKRERQAGVEESYVLVAGGRRMGAALMLGWDTIEASLREEMGAFRHRVLELYENLRRKELSWDEEVAMKEEIFRLRKEQDPDITMTQVASELGETKANFSRDLTTAEAIRDDEKLKTASSKRAALKSHKMKKHFEKKVRQAEKRKGSEGLIKIRERLVCEDMRDHLRTLDESSFDLVFPDLPYGIDHFKQGHKFNTGDGKAGTSEYDDSAATTQDLLVDAVPLMARVARPTGWIVCFMNRDNYFFLEDLFKRTCRVHYDYQVEDTTSCRSADSDDSPCEFLRPEPLPWLWYRPNSRNNPRYPELHAKNCYEWIMVVNMGHALLERPCNNVLVHDAHYGGDRIHAMQKPVSLCKELIQRTTCLGDRVLDPCFGSGAHLAAAAELGRHPYGCEQNEGLLKQAWGLVSKHYSSAPSRSSKVEADREARVKGESDDRGQRGITEEDRSALGIKVPAGSD